MDRVIYENIFRKRDEKMLIKCKECGTDISVNAASCPKCGNPQAMQKVVVENKVTGGGDIIHKIAVWGIFILIIFAIGTCVCVTNKGQVDEWIKILE